ncbi:MAG: Omp28-related outer membrane protein, partial [Bacteroidales bacterium]|nr:Omp28-related outer membrane protein [Bacteroidales bacterium]
ETMKTTLGIGGPPNLWLEFDHTYKLNPAGWKTAVKTRQNSPDADCGVGLLVERDGNSVNVYAKVRFFNQLSGNYNLAVYVVESGMISSQTTPSGTDPNYEHNLVLRDEIANGSAWGMPLFTGSSVDEYQVTIEYIPGPGIDLDNVKYVAVIYEMDATGKPVSSPNSNTK